MLRMYLTRHGQDKDNEKGILNGHRDEPLTDLGRAQAKEVAEKIKSAGIILDKVYTSPLVRTAETADIITGYLGLPKPEILDLLIERDFGVMTGQPHTKIMEMCAPDVLSTDSGVNYFLSPAGAETFPQLMERGKRLIKQMEMKHPDGNILLVSHGDFGKMVYAAFYNLDWKEVLNMFHFGNSDLLLLAPNLLPADNRIVKIAQHNQ